jgi:ABC-type transporter Mla subunit MlaD
MTAISSRNRHTLDSEATMPIASPDEIAPDGFADPPRRGSTTTNVARVLMVLALIPVGALYLYPRIYDLTATPYRLDQAVVSAGNYNPALDQIVEHEKVTLAAFDALEKMKAPLASVLSTDAAVTAELNTLTGQITGDVQKTLDLAGANVTDLVASLDTLTAHISSLQAPVDGATAAVAGDRATLDAILADARSTAAKVHSARLSAEESANDLSGK